MTDGTPNVTAYRLTPGRAEKLIRQIAEESVNVILIFGDHARARMLDREITDIDVFRVLRTGGIVGAPEPAERGEWKCKMVQRARGGRDIGVVAIILRHKKLFIKTIEWEDTRR